MATSTVPTPAATDSQTSTMARILNPAYKGFLGYLRGAASENDAGLSPSSARLSMLYLVFISSIILLAITCGMLFASLQRAQMLTTAFPFIAASLGALSAGHYWVNKKYSQGDSDNTDTPSK